MPSAQLGGSGNLNYSRAILLLALAAVSLPHAWAAAEPLYVTVYVDTALVNAEVLLNIRGRVTGVNQSAVALASVSIQVNDPYESSLHIALVYSDNSGEYSDIFQMPHSRPTGDYVIYVTASKPGFQDAYAKLTFSVGTAPFSISISPASVTVAPGKNATFEITLESRGPSISPVNVQVVGLPAHVSYTLSSSSQTVPSALTLTVETSEQVAPGSYTLTIIGTSDQGETRASAELIVVEKLTPEQPIWVALLAAAVILAVIVYRRRMKSKKPPVPQRATPEYLAGLTLSPSTLLSLPDHLRKTAIIVCQLGEASAVEVAARSGRARAAESDYLNQLARMGLLKKKRRGRESYFVAE